MLSIICMIVEFSKCYPFSLFFIHVNICSVSFFFNQILDAEIEYKNEGIRRLEEELDAVTESTSGNPSARVTDNLPHPPNLLPYLEHVTLPEAQSLLRKYFEKGPLL